MNGVFQRLTANLDPQRFRRMKGSCEASNEGHDVEMCAKWKAHLTAAIMRVKAEFKLPQESLQSAV